MKVWSDTDEIPFSSIFALLILGPIVAFVYSFYSFGYFMKSKGMPHVFLAIYAVPFAVLNTLHNWIVMTLVFKEFPQEFFTTQRLKRIKQSKDPSKRELADMLGGFLNRQDEGHY
jgi:type III secretory pathway component EscU